MDTSTLHLATEELAAVLSEVTQGDLKHPTPWQSWDVGDLYLHLMDQNIRVAAAIAEEPAPQRHRVDSMDRTALGNSLDLFGGGLEGEYRQTAQLMENAFANVTDSSRLCRVEGQHDEVEIAALYEMQLNSAVIHSWDMSQALGLTFEPPADVVWRVLRTLLAQRSDAEDDRAGSPDVSDIFECVLRLRVAESV